MNIRYLFSSPDGDIPLATEDLARPFQITPTEAHPFLTLEDYFESIKAFILREQARPLIFVLKEQLERDIDFDDIREILIRSEKHGGLYHLASIEILVKGREVKLTVSTAVSENACKWSVHEYEILNFLNCSFKFSFLPKVYFRGEIAHHVPHKKSETLAMCLSEWFEGYHEWHLSMDKTDNQQKICIWDQQTGNRYASQEEAFEIFRQAARIITLYYDTGNFNQIYPWHHAAGDFVVRRNEGDIDVKLTTARNYASVMALFPETTDDPIIAIVYFFLNLSVRMRLDRLDGVGKTVWAGSFAIRAVINGFFDALGIMVSTGRYELGKVSDLYSLLKSFDEEELAGLFQSLLHLYQEDDPEDLAVVRTNLNRHARELWHAFRADLFYESVKDFAGT